MHKTTQQILEKLRAERPLILNITNDVTMDFVANGLLSLGASPVMSQAIQEIDDLVKIASSVVINIGTLNADFIALAEVACRHANLLKKTLVLDPVGTGASRYRTKTGLDLLARFQFDIIRANASEVIALSGFSEETKGVDSTALTEHAIKSGEYLASQHQVVVVISGRADAVIDSNQVKLLEYGSPLMPMVTGSGCLLTSVVSSFNTVHPNTFEATQSAVAFYGMCGEVAHQKANGPGTFKPHFLDALSGSPKEGGYAK